MPVSLAEVQRWREAIVSDEWTPKYRLKQMARRRPQRFVLLCHGLLRDPSSVVQRVALEALWERGDPHDAAVQAITLVGTTDDALRSVVFEVLRNVRPADAFPALLALAEAGVTGAADALALASELAQTAQDRGRAMAVAHRYLYFDGNDANGDDLRRVASGVVGEGMGPPAWEDLYVKLARRYVDEDVIEALGLQATPQVIPALQDLLASIGPGCVESRALESAIQRIQARAAKTSEPANNAYSRGNGA
jgi:hypothetical protein